MPTRSGERAPLWRSGFRLWCTLTIEEQTNDYVLTQPALRNRTRAQVALLSALLSDALLPSLALALAHSYTVRSGILLVVTRLVVVSRQRCSHHAVYSVLE